MPAPLRRCRPGALVLSLLFLAGGALDAGAQTLVGRTVEDGRDVAVGGALVVLLDRDLDERARAVADAAGRFRLTPPADGEYYLQATRLGYEPTRSPLLALAAEGEASIDLVMRARPIGIEGLEVEVAAVANRMLTPYGLSVEQLGNRWIDRADIDAIAVKNDAAHVIQWANIAGITMPRPENMVPGSDDLGLCVSFRRGAMGNGTQRCALNVLDGQVVSSQIAWMLDPDAIEGIAVLQPVEAAQLYGEAGGAGAVLIWTRRGTVR